MELLGAGRQAEVFAVSDSECVKLFYPDCPKRVAESEAARMKFVTEHNVPSPRFIALEQIDGRYGIRMERLHGVTLLHDALDFFKPDVDYGGLLGSIQREYHNIRAEGFGDMADGLASAIRLDDTLSNAQRDEVIRRLYDMPRGDRLVHMDYHSDNVIVTPDGMKVIDWAGACAGNPLADVARTLLTLEQKAYPVDVDERMRRWLDDTRDACREGYLRGYGIRAEELAEWKPIIAASRLHCSYGEEKEQNVQLVLEYLKDS